MIRVDTLWRCLYNEKKKGGRELKFDFL